MRALGFLFLIVGSALILPRSVVREAHWGRSDNELGRKGVIIRTLIAIGLLVAGVYCVSRPL